MSPAPTSTRSRVIRQIATSILAGGVAPYVVYQVAHPHLGEVQSLLLGGVIPALVEIVSFVRHRRLDPMTTLSLAAMAVSVVLALTGGGPRVVLIKESFVTGAVGLGFLATLLAKRPALYYLGRQLSAGDVPEQVAAFEAKFEASAGMRKTLRTMTAVWGVALIADLLLRLAVVFTLTTEQALIAGPVVFYSIILALIAWTVRFAARKGPTTTESPADSSTAPKEGLSS